MCLAPNWGKGKEASFYGNTAAYCAQRFQNMVILPQFLAKVSILTSNLIASLTNYQNLVHK